MFLRRLSSTLAAYGAKHVTPGLSRITPGVVSSASGSWVEYDNGKKYLDFTSGIGVTGLGHCHPQVTQSVVEQAGKAVHIQCGIAFHEPYLRLIQNLLPVMPHPSLDTFFFWNSGSEAVEAAIKICRVATGKSNIIALQGGYHGRTFGAMAITTSKTIYHKGFSPLMPNTHTIPFPYFHQMLRTPSANTEELVQECLAQFRLTLKQRSAPSDTAAVIIEPVLGEGGYVVAPPSFLQGLREICTENQILLVVDEVQSGFGRTGDMWAVEESGIIPDVLITAKGLANGFPLSGVITSSAVSSTLESGSMGGTYAGNPVSCAAACSVLDVMFPTSSSASPILSNVQSRSTQLLSFLSKLQADPEIGPHILDVRGKGLMVGLEFTPATSPFGSADPNIKEDGKGISGISGKVMKKCVEEGLIILTTSVFETIRFIPPLTITEEEMDIGCKIFEKSFRAVVRGE